MPKEVYQIFQIGRKAPQLYFEIEEEFANNHTQLAQGAYLIGDQNIMKFPEEIAIKLNTLDSSFFIVSDKYTEEFENIIDSLPRVRNNKGKLQKQSYLRGIERMTLDQNYIPLIFIVDHKPHF